MTVVGKSYSEQWVDSLPGCKLASVPTADRGIVAKKSATNMLAVPGHPVVCMGDMAEDEYRSCVLGLIDDIDDMQIAQGIRLGCRAPTGDNVYTTEEAAKLQPNLNQPVTWYYAVVGGSQPIVFSLFIVSPFMLCSRFRLVLATIEYFSPSSGAGGQHQIAYKTLVGTKFIDTGVWDQSQPFKLSFTDSTETKWLIERSANSTHVIAGEVDFELEDNDSMYPQGVAPTSFNRASQDGYSTSYVTSVLNARASGTIAGEKFSDVFSYLEHVDTAAFSPKTPTPLVEQNAQVIEWACIYVFDENSPFMFQGCGNWDGSYNPYTVGTLVDKNGKRSGFTRPGFDLRPVSGTQFTSANAQVEFYRSYSLKIQFGDTLFHAHTKPLIPDTDFGVGVKGSATYIQPIDLVRRDESAQTTTQLSGILGQVRMNTPVSTTVIGYPSPQLMLSIETMREMMRKKLSKPHQ